MDVLPGETERSLPEEDVADDMTQNFVGITQAKWRAAFVQSATKLVEDVGLDG